MLEIVALRVYRGLIFAFKASDSDMVIWNISIWF